MIEVWCHCAIPWICFFLGMWEWSGIFFSYCQHRIVRRFSFL